MEHKLIEGGEQYLPFARSRIKALQALGLPHAKQSFDMPDGTVEVRITPGQEYIHLTGSGAEYLVNPRSTLTDHQGGVYPKPLATVTLKEFPKPKAKEHADLLAGPVDWKGESRRLLTYNGLASRYRLSRSLQRMTGSDGVFRDGKRVNTNGIYSAGAAVVHRTLSSGETFDRIVLAVTNGRSIEIVSQNKNKDGWILVGQYISPADVLVTYTDQIGGVLQDTAGFVDPVYFDPKAENLVTIMTAYGAFSQFQAVIPVRGVIKVYGTTDDEAYIDVEFTADEPYSMAEVATSSSDTSSSGSQADTAYFPDSHGSPYTPNASGTETTSNHSRNFRKTLIAIDYAADGTEVLLTYSEEYTSDVVTTLVATSSTVGVVDGSSPNPDEVPPHHFEIATLNTTTTDAKYVTKSEMAASGKGVYTQTTTSTGRQVVETSDIEKTISGSLGLYIARRATTDVNTVNIETPYTVLYGVNARTGSFLAHKVLGKENKTISITKIWENGDYVYNPPTSESSVTTPATRTVVVTSDMHVVLGGTEVFVRPVSTGTISPEEPNSRVNTQYYAGNMTVTTDNDANWASARPDEAVVSCTLKVSDLGVPLATSVVGDFSRFNGCFRGPMSAGDISAVFSIGSEDGFSFAPVCLLSVTKEK